MSDLELRGDIRAGFRGMILNYAHANFGSEDHHQEAGLVNVRHEHAEVLALLIDAVEIFLVDEVGDGLERSLSVPSITVLKPAFKRLQG